MSWSYYLRSMLERETALDDLAITINGERFEVLPSILKASVLLTDQLLDTSKRNMFVFPEQRTCSYVFMLLRTLHNIAEGRVSGDYDPYKFVIGEKLKFMKSVVEFVGIEIDKRSGLERIFIKFADGMKLGIPLDNAPFLQHVQTKRLSKYESFSKEYNTFQKELSLHSSMVFIQKLLDYKTHLDGSSVFVAPILSTRKLLLDTLLNDKKVSDLLLLAQSDVGGNVRNMTAGQLAGTPAIVLCQDLYAVCEVIESGLSVNAIFIEATQAIIDNQLDALDDLIAKNISIVLMADQANLTNYSGLESRDFNVWTWNEKTITPDIYRGSSRLDVKVRNSAMRKTRYLDILCPEVSNSISLLYKNKRLIEDQSAAIIQVFQDLFEIALIVLRAVTPLTNCTRITEILEKCKATLAREKDYIRKELFAELAAVIDNLETVYTSDSEPPKVLALIELLKGTANDTVYIIVPQNTDKNEIISYLRVSGIGDDISIIATYPIEYSQSDEVATGLTVVSGWLNRSTMNKILNSNITPEIVTLIYETEKLWKNGCLRENTEQSKRNNAMIARILSSIEDGLADELIGSESDVPSFGYSMNDEAFDSSGVDEIELTLRKNKYRRYILPTAEDSVSAIPVSFVGDFVAFYRTGRTLLTATKLINEDYNSIEEVKPGEIQPGDFIIERETQRDLIRDIADVILKNSNCFELRETAHKWKEALDVESVFSDEGAICDKLMMAGCTRGKMTIRNWLTDDSMITPLSKDDIVYIAKATDDSILLEMVEQVYSAGKVIKSAHIQAGHHLAEKLRTNLVDALFATGSIDGFNVWQPIEMDVENIGSIKLLKVIDVGSEVFVDATSTNRLIDTNKALVKGDGENGTDDSFCPLP